MILTDREIQIFIERGTIVIDPRPVELAYSSTSVDLTLDPTISIFKNLTTGLDLKIDPAKPGFKTEEALKEITTTQAIGDDGYSFAPGQFILAWTTEYVHLKYDARIAARVEGKSSLARLGVGVHVTAPTIHAGFEGSVRLEMVNHGSLPIILRKGMRICQLIFETTLGTPAKGYQGQFAGQKHQ